MKTKHINTLPEKEREADLLPNYPSIRTFISKLESTDVELVARFNFYLSLAFPVKKDNMHHYLESVTESLGCRISNYTISGFICSRQYGPRHKPRQRSIECLNRLIVWLEDNCRTIGTWKPFKFRYKPSEFDTPNQPTK